jgi:hypothetical protein
MAPRVCPAAHLHQPTLGIGERLTPLISYHAPTQSYRSPARAAPEF